MTDPLTTKADRESAAKVGEWLAEDFNAGTWENDFVSRLAKDAIALQERVEALTQALRDYGHHKRHCKWWDKDGDNSCTCGWEAARKLVEEPH